MSGEGREIKILEGVLNTDLPMLGWNLANVAVSEIRIDGNGDTTLYVNFSNAVPASDDVAAYVRLKSVVGFLPAAMQTMSHASGQSVHSGCICELVCEQPATFINNHSKLLLDLLQILRGIFGSPINVFAAANGTVPAIKGMLAAGADANIPASPLSLGVGRGIFGGI